MTPSWVELKSCPTDAAESSAFLHTTFKEKTTVPNQAPKPFNIVADVNNTRHTPAVPMANTAWHAAPANKSHLTGLNALHLNTCPFCHLHIFCRY